ncbi:MAG: hypothetical protein JXA51_00250 [Dehalococcoidales bacterium]|nr:hypothetical protein [Dehalococcoidales bacterium]
MSDLVSTILIGVALVLVLVLSVFVQGWRTRRAPIGKVVGIASDVRHNEKLCENYDEGHVPGRFRTGAWDKHREKVDFLPVELRNDLKNLFEQASELNVTIDTARKLGLTGYVSPGDVEKLKAPLASCKDSLREWVYANMNNPAYLPKKRGLFRR